MSWSPCECVTADVTRSEHRHTRFSLAANHCSASRNQPLKPAVHRAPKHHPPKHTPIPPWMHEQKDFFLPPHSHPNPSSLPPFHKPNPKIRRREGQRGGVQQLCPAAPLCRDKTALCRSAPRHHWKIKVSSKSHASPH